MHLVVRALALMAQRAGPNSRKRRACVSSFLESRARRPAGEPGAAGERGDGGGGHFRKPRRPEGKGRGCHTLRDRYQCASGLVLLFFMCVRQGPSSVAVELRVNSWMLWMRW